MFKKISLKVALFVNIILFAVIAGGAFYLIKQQNKDLERQFLAKAQHLTQIGSRSVGRVFNEAIDNGVLTVNNVFDKEYQIIPGFEPKKYHTAYDFYLDKAILDIEDEFLKDNSVVFAVAVDTNGYLPTHNSRYQKAITRDKNKDLHGNRTKRIFNDPIGINAAKNTKPGFKQVYHRDTGKVMWDISSPIYVKNRHWGAFRIGLSLDYLNQVKVKQSISLLIIMSVILVVSLLAVFIVVDMALKPLTDFTKRASALADGDVEKEIVSNSNDEIGELADVLERLRVSLKTAMDRIMKNR